MSETTQTMRYFDGESTILVVGHRNPDNDSICSAIACAYLKNATKDKDGIDYLVHYEPARLGPLPQESAWLIQKYGLQEPTLVSHVRARVMDAMTPDPVSVLNTSTIMEVGHILRHHNINSVVVMDELFHYCGLVTTRMIANRYLQALELLDEKDLTSQMAVATDLIRSLNQNVSEIMETDVKIFDKESLLSEATEELMNSSLREAIVLDDNDYAVGILTRSDLAKQPKRQVVLVDHNELRQAAPGVDEAEVLEIYDHHRIADITTAKAIRFLNLPVGCTSTILCLEYRRLGIEVPKEIAAAMLSAIMTDTVILKSPTTTDIDREQVEWLANILEVDPTEFGLEIFRARSPQGDLTVKQIVSNDSKEFQLGDATVLIAQHETVELNAVLSREEEIRAYMRGLQEKHNYEFVLLMITDIIAEGSQLFCEGNRNIVNRLLGINCTGKGGTWMPGLLSRKKQVAPYILG